MIGKDTKSADLEACTIYWLDFKLIVLTYLFQMQDGTQAVVQQPAQLAQGGQVIQLAAANLPTAAATVTQAHQPHQTTTTTGTYVRSR